jgi:transposase
MIDIFKNRAIWLYKPKIDFRKQMNGLIAVIVSKMGLRPNDGGIYIFRNRQRDKIKILFWDRNGFVLGYKRLEKGKFDVPIDISGTVELTLDQLGMLVSGMPLIHLGKDAEKKVFFS